MRPYIPYENHQTTRFIKSKPISPLVTDFHRHISATEGIACQYSSQKKDNVKLTGYQQKEWFDFVIMDFHRLLPKVKKDRVLRIQNRLSSSNVEEHLKDLIRLEVYCSLILFKDDRRFNGNLLNFRPDRLRVATPLSKWAIGALHGITAGSTLRFLYRRFSRQRGKFIF